MDAKPAKHELGLASQDKRFIDRCMRICSEFEYGFKYFDNPENFSVDQVEYRIFIVAGLEFPNGGEFSAFLSTLRMNLPEVFLLFVEHSKSVENSIQIAKTFGCNLTLGEQEFFSSSKPEYICSQVIRATYLPIKSSDITDGKALNFDLYHFMPQREKFLKFCFSGDQIDPKKLEKIKSIDEVYIHRDQADNFSEYITSTTGGTHEESLNRRCRGQFIALYANYTKLVFQITDQSEKSSFQSGQELLKKCRSVAVELLGTLASHPNAWNIIHKATVGDFGSVERAPAVAAYAGIVGATVGLQQIDDLMIAALLSELGILLLPKEINDHIRKDTIDQLTLEQVNDFQNYPVKSLNLLLDKRMQVEEKLRNIIVSVHERSDKKGFPGKKFGNHIPIESAVVHFAHELDRRTRATIGKPRLGLEQAIEQFLLEEAKTPAHFTLQVAIQLRLALKTKLKNL